MAKITIFSTRIYKDTLAAEDTEAILRDIKIYQSMFKKCYKELLDNINYGNGTKLTPKYLKSIYPTNDYFPLSAILQSKTLIKSQVTWRTKTLKNRENRVKKIDEKIKKVENELKKYQQTLTSLIALSKARKVGKVKSVFLCPDLRWSEETPNVCTYKGERMYVYLFEEKKLKPKIKELKHRIKQLKYGKQRVIESIQRLKFRMKGTRFEKSNYIRITGRAQGKYGNNLFKYDHENKMMTYIDTKQRKIIFPLDFPYQRQELVRVLKMKHATPGKAVCYTLIDKGDYFIIQATIELEKKDLPLNTQQGVVGIDINASVIAIAETDAYGNLIMTTEITVPLKKKSSRKRRWIIEQKVNEIIRHCHRVNKPLIIETLDFEKKKQDFKIYQQDRNYNRMLSEFAYRMITDKLYSRAYKEDVAIKEVDPKYTSQIGKAKYAKMKGISVHRSAAYVISRRGMGFNERLPKRLMNDIQLSPEKRWKKYLSKKS